MFDKEIVIHNSKPPLRWLANFAGLISGKVIVKQFKLNDIQNFKIKYKLYGKIFNFLWPLYRKYGTFYTLEYFNSSNAAWDDYDDNEIPYWDYDWHTNNPEDDWRLIKRGV